MRVEDLSPWEVWRQPTRAWTPQSIIICSVENLKQFVDDLLEGKLEPYMKSEPVPSEQGDVKVAVAKNFKELIMDADRDALIEFYAPWCGHCKSLAPKYEELAS